MFDINKIEKWKQYDNLIENGEDIFGKLSDDDLRHYVVLVALKAQENFSDNLYHTIRKNRDSFPREWKEKICRKYYMEKLCCDVTLREGVEMYVTNTTVMFTGPRPKKLAGYVRTNYQQFVDDLSQYICQLYDLGYLFRRIAQLKPYSNVTRLCAMTHPYV